MISRAAGVPLDTLNVGGGFPSRYPLSDAPGLETFFAAIETARRTYFPANEQPALECEPGRGLVATSTSLLTKVKLRRADTNEVFLNDGIYGGLMEGYQVPSLSPAHRAFRSGSALRAALVPFVVFGPTCAPLDRLPNELLLPSDIAEGDYVEFGPLGAYGDATTTRFNGYGTTTSVPVANVQV